MRRQLLGAVLLLVAIVPAAAAQKIALPGCRRPVTPDTSAVESLTLPAAGARARVVAAFDALGLALSPALTSGDALVWDSGMHSSGLGTAQRTIRANLVPLGVDSTRVTLAATERLALMLGGENGKALTSTAHGYGFKVWCAREAVSTVLRRATGTADSATIALADSLTAAYGALAVARASADSARRVHEADAAVPRADPMTGR